MTLVRWSPNRTLAEIDGMMDRMHTMRNTALAPIDGDAPRLRNTHVLAVDVASDENHVIVRAPLPGFKEDEVDVSVNGNLLTISAETKTEHEDKQDNWHIRELRYGKFARSIVLPVEVVANEADAELENGILTVRLRKKEPNPIRKIVVKAKQLLTGKEEAKS
jgi:HSP20 family protein